MLKGLNEDICLSTVKFNLKLINIKVFFVVLAFSLFSGFYETIVPFLHPFIRDLGYTVMETGLITNLWETIVFFLNSILLFAVLYLICRRDFIENIASIIVSLIVATVAGYWIGGLLGVAVLQIGFSVSPSIFIFSNLLFEFAACSAAYVTARWRLSMPRTEIAYERPFGVALIAALYIILGISLTILTFVLFGLFYTVSLEAILNKPLIFIGLILLLAIASSMYFAVAYGFYRGRRWGWLVVFTSTLVGIFLSINQLVFRFYFDVWFIVKILVLLLDIFIFIYLLQPHVRIYFGIINPSLENISETSSSLQS